MTTALSQLGAQWLTDFNLLRRYAVCLFLLVFMVFYFLTAANNFSETDDVFAFAYRTENFAFSHVSDPRLMLYHMLNRAVYLSINILLSPFELHVSALHSMRFLSIVCAALSLFLLFRVMTINLKLHPVTALFGSLLLAFSYGYWRYAAEAEVYIPAIMLCLLVFHLLHTTVVARLSSVIWIGAIAGMTILFYQPAVIPLLFAFPFILLSTTHWPKMLVYGLTACGIVVIGYLWGFWLYWPSSLDLSQFIAFLSQRSEEFMVPSLSVKTVILSMVKSLFAIGHDFTSANWIFAWPSIADSVQRLFPDNILLEERFMAEHIGAMLYLLLIIQSMLLLSCAGLFLKAMKYITLNRYSRTFWVVVVWLVLNGLIIGRLNPGGIEAWVMVFPAIMLIVATILIEPLVKRHRRLLGSVIVLLAAQNFIGGMYLVSNSESDYHQMKGKWLIENSQPQDLIIIAGDASLTEAIRYLAKAQVINVSQYDRHRIALALTTERFAELSIRTRGRDFDESLVKDVLKETINKGGRVFVFEEFLGSIDESGNILLDHLARNSQRVFLSPRTTDTFMLMTPQ
jgi:hypothetical protein